MLPHLVEYYRQKSLRPYGGKPSGGISLMQQFANSVDAACERDVERREAERQQKNMDAHLENERRRKEHAAQMRKEDLEEERQEAAKPVDTVMVAMVAAHYKRLLDMQHLSLKPTVGGWPPAPVEERKPETYIETAQESDGGVVADTPSIVIDPPEVIDHRIKTEEEERRPRLSYWQTVPPSPIVGGHTSSRPRASDAPPYTTSTPALPNAPLVRVAARVVKNEHGTMQVTATVQTPVTSDASVVEPVNHVTTRRHKRVHFVMPANPPLSPLAPIAEPPPGTPLVKKPRRSTRHRIAPVAAGQHVVYDWKEDGNGTRVPTMAAVVDIADTRNRDRIVTRAWAAKHGQ